MLLFLTASCKEEQTKRRNTPAKQGENQSDQQKTDVKTPEKQFYRNFKSSTNPFLAKCPNIPPDVYVNKSRSYNDENALFFSSFFAATGDLSKEDYSSKLTTMGFEKIDWFIDATKDVFSFIASNSELVVVHYRGTSDTKGWFLNSRFYTLEANTEGDGELQFKGFMHGGFKQAYKSIKTDFEAALKNHSSGDKPIYFSGHSLGGALTTISAARAKLNGHNVAGVYTGGQPRLGDPVFSDHINGLIAGLHFRLIFEDDMVARIPPTKEASSTFINTVASNDLITGAVAGIVSAIGNATLKKANYVHRADSIYLSTESEMSQRMPPSGASDLEFWRKWDAQISGITDLFNTDLVKDHESSNYACTLAKIVQNKPR